MHSPLLTLFGLLHIILLCSVTKRIDRRALEKSLGPVFLPLPWKLSKLLSFSEVGSDFQLNLPYCSLLFPFARETLLSVYMLLVPHRLSLSDVL